MYSRPASVRSYIHASPTCLYFTSTFGCRLKWWANEHSKDRQCDNNGANVKKGYLALSARILDGFLPFFPRGLLIKRSGDYFLQGYLLVSTSLSSFPLLFFLVQHTLITSQVIIISQGITTILGACEIKWWIAADYIFFQLWRCEEASASNWLGQGNKAWAKSIWSFLVQAEYTNGGEEDGQHCLFGDNAHPYSR